MAADVTDIRDRYEGALLGLAVGDALGTTLELRPPGTFEPLTDMVGGGHFHLPPGTWTDDTSMALCLAHSLVERGGFDPLDQMQRYVAWYRDGYMSSIGRCFDIGNTTRASLERFERTREPYAGSTAPYAAGNGSIMRLAPVPMFFRRDPAAAIRYAADSSRTDSSAQTQPSDIRGTHYVAESREAALGAFHRLRPGELWMFGGRSISSTSGPNGGLCEAEQEAWLWTRITLPSCSSVTNGGSAGSRKFLA